MANAKLIQLDGSQIHGFHSMEDLDMSNMMEEAKGRWLRPNEIHAILSNHKHFTIFVKPINLPKSGTVVLFDRKMLRNFRKDGHNWKKKNDRKTVKEAHEHLKVGNEERIHVYYAHGEDNSTFVRRCYWLLDKSLEHIVLVHYRETQEMQGSPVTPGNSNSTSAASAYSDPSPPWVLSEENDSVVDQSYYSGNGAKPHLAGDNDTVHGHKMTLHEINTLEWDELVMPDDYNNLIASEEGGEPLKTADSFERWMNYIISDSPEEIYDTVTTPDSSISTEQESYEDPTIDHHQSSSLQQIFSITDVSPAWAPSKEETKVLVVGFFHKDHQHVMNSNLFCVCGDVAVPAENIQSGVFRCLVPPQNPGLVNLYLSFDGRNAISLPVAFEYRSPTPSSQMSSATVKSNGRQFQVQMRLAHLLFSTSKSLNILSSKVSPKSLREAKVFTRKTSHIIGSWEYMIKSIGDNTIPSPQAKDSLFELTLQNRLLEWLLERVIDGSKISDHDDQGQGVIHLCAILGYTWAIYPFSWSGLSLDYRDKFGWTALHWAAFFGREKMVATLLSAGAKPNLVTDPTSEYPGGRTAADLASKNGYDGLAAYLSEKSLVSHFKDMTVAGNVSGSLQSTSTSTEESIVGPSGLHVSQEDLYMKDTLTAYRAAADAAARIQAAFRDQSYKLQKKEVQASNTEDEARSIIAAMKIQHAFRNHETKKKMAAAARLQHRFRTWKLRKEFLNMRRQAIKIQAIIRGIRARRQYRKIIWSVGVVEKAILRWRLKRKGFRGLKVNPDESTESFKPENGAEEDFFYASRKQAEERIERSVVRVQAMFRSKKAQEEYQTMKQAHYEAMLEYEGLNDRAIDMEK